MTSPKLFEYNLTRLLIIGAFFICGLFGAKIVSAVYYQKTFTKLSEPARLMQEQYKEQINSETDPIKLCRLGLDFEKSQNTELAYLSFSRATELDPNLRDGWIWKANLELQNDQPDEAIASLKKAESIDPVNPKTYELLAIAYEQIDDADSAQKAREKFEYLTKQK